MKKIIIIILTVLTVLSVGCTQTDYEKQFNEADFEKVDINSFQQAISLLDTSSKIQLIELDQEYVDSHKEDSFISGGAYCDNKQLSFGKYGLAINPNGDPSLKLSSVKEIRDHFQPIDNMIEAAVFVLLEFENIDYNSIYVSELEREYLIKLIQNPSACTCGTIQTKELWFVVEKNGLVKSIKKEIIKTDYAENCVG
jgi:hypothetical protein